MKYNYLNAWEGKIRNYAESDRHRCITYGKEPAVNQQKWKDYTELLHYPKLYNLSRSAVLHEKNNYKNSREILAAITEIFVEFITSFESVRH